MPIKPAELSENDRADQCLSELVESVKKARLTTSTLVILLSNLLYSVGASIEGFDGEGPSVDETLKGHYSNPSNIGYALMAQGLLMNQEWVKTIDKMSGK